MVVQNLGREGEAIATFTNQALTPGVGVATGNVAKRRTVPCTGASYATLLRLDGVAQWGRVAS